MSFTSRLGPSGPIGAEAERGPTGPTGATGAPGATGPMGEPGESFLAGWYYSGGIGDLQPVFNTSTNFEGPSAISQYSAIGSANPDFTMDSDTGIITYSGLTSISVSVSVRASVEADGARRAFLQIAHNASGLGATVLADVCQCGDIPAISKFIQLSAVRHFITLSPGDTLVPVMKAGDAAGGWFQFMFAQIIIRES